MASFGRFSGPVTNRSTPGSVSKTQGTWKVSTPLPKWPSAGAVPPGSGRTSTASLAGRPSHDARNDAGQRISQPWPLAMSSGRQR